MYRCISAMTGHHCEDITQPHTTVMQENPQGYGRVMIKREVLFCTTLILIGTLDWITTLVGILFFGATETNPLLTNLTQSNILLFSVVKLSAITLTGVIFYKAEILTKLTAKSSPFAKKFLNAGYVISLIMLTAVVLNNFSAILKVA